MDSKFEDSVVELQCKIILTPMGKPVIQIVCVAVIGLGGSELEGGGISVLTIVKNDSV